MSKVGLVAISAIVLMLTDAGLPRAAPALTFANISAKKLSIKDNADPAKRQIKVQSADPAVTYDEASDPALDGAAIHVYSSTDDFCAHLGPGLEWQYTPRTGWKYRNKATKNVAQIKDGRLLVKVKSGITYTLNEAAQGTVNVWVQFGSNGTPYCMRCPGNEKDEMNKFVAKACVAAACDPLPSSCAACAGCD